MKEERIKFIKFSPSGSLNLFYMTPEQQMGKPLSILAKINNIETPICLDTGAGANAINTNYLKKLGINPIATKIFEKPIAIEVGNSQTTSVTETVLLQLHTKEHVSYVWFLKIDELPIKAILGYTSATILNITMQSGGEIYWDKEHIPKTDIPMGIYYSTVSSADKKQAIQELYPTKRTIIPAQSKKEVSVSTKETNDKASSGEAHAQLLIQKLY